MKCLLALALLASCSAVSPSVAPQESGPDNLFSVYLGQRNLDEGDYAPVEEQPMLAIEFASNQGLGPMGWEVGLAGSSDESGIFTGSTGELYVGLHKGFGADTVRPYLGLGLAWIRSKVEADGFGDDDDASPAGYVHAGIDFAVTQAFLIGLDVRVLGGSDLTIAGVDTDADYGQIALAFRFGF